MPELGELNIQCLLMTKTKWEAGIAVNFVIVVTIIILAVIIDIMQIRKTVKFAEDHVASKWQEPGFKPGL